ESGAVVKIAALGVPSTEFERSRENTLGADRVAAAQEHLTEQTKREWRRRSDRARLHQRRLRFVQRTGSEVHATDGEHHLRVRGVTRERARSDLADQLGVARRGERSRQG